MKRIPDYPAIYSTIYGSRTRSIFSVELQTTIINLSAVILAQGNPQTLLFDFQMGLKSLPVSSIVRAQDEIRQCGGMQFEYEEPPGLSSAVKYLLALIGFGQKSKWGIELDALKKRPELGLLFQFHGDGHIREAALKSLKEPADNPFEFAAIVFRLNDWVGEVRDAAYQYAQEYFPQTCPTVIAEAAFFLLPHTKNFDRWNAWEEELLETTIYRDDVLVALEDRLLQSPPGRVGRVFRKILQKPDFDKSLARLSKEAKMPVVRAIALEAIVLKRARWFISFKHEWHNKIFGIRRRVAQFEERQVVHELDIEEFLIQGSNDKSASVRKIVADTLIGSLKNPSPVMDGLAQKLSRDKNAAVRSRADFYISKRTFTS